MKLNLGCSGHILLGYVNVDCRALPGTGINAYTGDFLGEWLKPWRRIKRLAVRLGYRPMECRGCGVAG